MVGTDSGFAPTDDDHDPDRVLRDAERNAKIARGAGLAQAVKWYPQPAARQWEVRYNRLGHYEGFFGPTLADALIALAEAIDRQSTGTSR